MTALELIKGSLRLIGVIAAGQDPSAGEQSDALESLNGMLDSWSTEGLAISAYERDVLTLTAGQGKYTLGATGDLLTTRPMRIARASVGDSGSVVREYPLEVLSPQQWAEISNKTLQSNWPTKLYVEGSHPLETLNLWPVPSASVSLILYAHKPFATLAGSDALTLPPGYDRAIKYNLAIELAPEFGKEPSPSIVAIANEAKANIKRQNTKPVYTKSDAAGLPVARRSFNIVTGE